MKMITKKYKHYSYSLTIYGDYWFQNGKILLDYDKRNIHKYAWSCKFFRTKRKLISYLNYLDTILPANTDAEIYWYKENIVWMTKIGKVK